MLLLPGAALIRACRINTRRMPVLELIMWILLVSIGASVLGGLVLNLLGGLTRTHWIIAISVFVLACTITSIFTTSGGAHSHEYSQVKTVPRRPSHFRPSALLLYLLAGGVIAAAVVVAQLSTSAARERFSQLWLVPITHSTPDQDASQSLAQLGCHNFEGQSEQFVVSLYVGASLQPSERWSVNLRNGAQWSVDVPRPAHSSLRGTLLISGSHSPADQFVTLQAPEAPHKP